MIKLKFSDVGKFLASSAVVYSSAFAETFYNLNSSFNDLNDSDFGLQKIELKEKLMFSGVDALYKAKNQTIYTVGAYKLVDSVFEFKSVHVEAGVSTLAGAAAGALEVFMSNGLYIKNEDGFNYKGLVNIGTKAIASGALAYINHDYSSDPVELNDGIDPLNLNN